MLVVLPNGALPSPRIPGSTSHMISMSVMIVAPLALNCPDAPLVQFNAKTVGLWASTGSNPLVKVVQNMAAATSTNSEDFHVGVLRIVNDAVAENWYFSGVFIENGPITTAIGTGAPPASAPSSVPPSSAPPSSAPSSVPPSSVPPTSKPSSAPVSSSSSAPVAIQTQYGQCGGELNGYQRWNSNSTFLVYVTGTGYTGPTVCAAGFTCKAISPPYYTQVCLLNCLPRTR